MDWEPASKSADKPRGKKRRGCLVAVVIVVLLLVIAGVSRCGGGGDERLDWPTSGLATMLPKPESGVGNVVINDNEKFSASVDGYTQEQFDSYVAQCQEKGFSVEATSDVDELDAYTEDGHHLTLHFYDSLENMDINLEAPMEMGTISWPTAGAGSLVPAPTSTTGSIDSDSSGFFFAYVGETSAEDYAAYVDACSSAGFNVDYDRGDTWYGADNADGVSLRVEYRGFDTMSVRVDVPDGAEAEPVAEGETASEETTTPTADASGVNPDFKATMDGYESYINEYIDFLNTYNSDPSNVVGMLTQYNEMMQEYADWTEQINAINESSLSAADLAYYTEVMGRVNARLLEIGQ